MGSKTEITLQNFFIFNSTYGPKEGEESKKILYYYPITDNADTQIKNVGLVEGIIQFTGQTSQCTHCTHKKQDNYIFNLRKISGLFLQTLNLPTIIKNKEGVNQIDYLEDDLQDNVYNVVLQQSYFMYRLFWGTFENSEAIDTLKTRLENFYRAYLKTVKLAHCDILNIFTGIQYLPLDKLTFLKVQCFVNLLESNFSEVDHSVFLYNDHLIWSGVEPGDMKTLYQYLIGTLLPAHMESELQGGSMPRNLITPFTSLHHGRFITGPTNPKTAKTIEKVPKVYLYFDEKPSTYHMVVYRALSASICLFVKADTELTIDLFRKLDEFISPKLTDLVSDVFEYCSKRVTTPNLPENGPRFIYFNKLNLAYKSTIHTDNKQTGNVSCPKESLKIMADLNSKKDLLGHSNETIVKTMNDYWVVLKTSNLREFYIALQQKNASLIDISEEVKKLCETELKGIFFHPM